MPCLRLRYDSMMLKLVHEILFVSRFASNRLGQAEKILTSLCMAGFPKCHQRAQFWQFPA